jgi:peptidyl-prolyl cis-trans isomerase SurA
VLRNGDDVTVRHILKVPRVNEGDIQKAVSKLDSVRALLLSGEMEFGEAVSKFSDEEQSKFTGGRKTAPDGSSQITIDQLGKELVGLLDDLQPGKYSVPQPFTDERGKKGVRLIYLISRTDPHRENLKDDYGKIANRAIEEKKEQQLKKWFLKNASSIYVRLEDEYSQCAALQQLMGQ